MPVKCRKASGHPHPVRNHSGAVPACVAKNSASRGLRTARHIYRILRIHRKYGARPSFPIFPRKHHYRTGNIHCNRCQPDHQQRANCPFAVGIYNELQGTYHRHQPRWTWHAHRFDGKPDLLQANCPGISGQKGEIFSMVYGCQCGVSG